VRLESGKVAVVTGAGSGIGAALALDLARRGLHLVICDRRSESLAGVWRQLLDLRTEVIAQPLDVTDAAALESLAEQTFEKFGRVDLLCNNVGTLGPYAAVWEQEPTAWGWVFDVIVGGTVNGVRAFVPHLVTAGSGHVLNTASVAGLVPLAGLGCYTAAKHALMGLSVTLAEELRQAAPGVGVTVACPGAVDTAIATTSYENLPASVIATTTTTLELSDQATAAMGPVISAERAAQRMLAAVEAGRLFVATHDETAHQVSVEAARLVRELTLPL
jgi:NADP-dependent 3-hydroxy acid dehydrogenase YdfG